MMTWTKLKDFLCNVPPTGMSNYFTHSTEQWIDGKFERTSVTMRADRPPTDYDPNHRIMTISTTGLDKFARLTINISELNSDLFALENARIKIGDIEGNLRTPFEPHTDMPYSVFWEGLDEMMLL